jgi:hypothetical protein
VPLHLQQGLHKISWITSVISLDLKNQAQISQRFIMV